MRLGSIWIQETLLHGEEVLVAVAFMVEQVILGPTFAAQAKVLENKPCTLAVVPSPVVFVDQPVVEHTSHLVDPQPDRLDVG